MLNVKTIKIEVSIKYMIREDFVGVKVIKDIKDLDYQKMKSFYM